MRTVLIQFALPEGACVISGSDVRKFEGGKSIRKNFLLTCCLLVSFGACAQAPYMMGIFTNEFSYAGHSPEVAFEQGVATDGTNNYLFSTGYLRKMDAAWKNTLAGNYSPFSGLSGYNHLGAGTYYNGELYVSAETYNGCSAVANPSIFVFNAADLSRISVTVVSNFTSEISAVTVAPDLGTNGIVFISNFCDGSHLYEFDLSSLAYLGSILLDATIPSIQGLAYHSGLIYAVADSGANGVVYDIDPNTGHVQNLAFIVFPYCREVEGCDYSTSNLWIMATGSSNYVYYFSPWQVGTTNNPTTIVRNGGFETGDSAYWTLTGNTASLSVSTNPDCVHSGAYGVQASSAGALSYFSQTLATVPGQPYLLSLWLDSPDGATPNEFTVSWNGTNLFDGVNLGVIGWTNLQFIVNAPATGSLLQIGARNDLSHFGLDDISVIPISSMPPVITQPPASETLPLGADASFSTMVIGTSPLAYQWYFNTNTPVSGATNAVLALGPVMANLAGNYQVIITNFYGSVTSSPAALIVQMVPTILMLSNNADGATILYLASFPGSTNRLWATTNLSLPMAQWQVVATNSADSNGFLQITDTNAIGQSMMFYRLSMP